MTGAPAGTPVRAAVRAATNRLAAAGVPAAEHDAELLAAHVLRTDRRHLAGTPPLTAAESVGFDRLVERRAARVPVQHLVGRAAFHRVEIGVGPGIFVPRPETELLVEWLAADLRARRRPDPVVVDLCSGPGTIALALAHACPGARISGLELDPVALAAARGNAAESWRPGTTAVSFHQGDVRDAATLLRPLLGRVDAVAANPPYLPDALASALEPEVRVHEPATALFGGPDGLAVIRPVLDAAALLLAPGGVLAVEHGDDQGERVPGLLAAAGGWTGIADHRDLNGRPRFATARRPARSGRR